MNFPTFSWLRKAAFSTIGRMKDQRIENLANILVHYCVKAKRGEIISVTSSYASETLVTSIYESLVKVGLNLGANDYVTKPFSIKELIARIRAFLRATSREHVQQHRFGDFTMDLRARQLKRAGALIELTPKEYELLAYFAEQRGRALTRDQILNAVWGYDVLVTQRSVDRCVTTLRNKIESDPASPTFIKAIRGVGYRFEGLLEADA